MFKLSDSEPLDGTALAKFIREHEKEKQRYKRLKEQYLSQPDILRKPRKEAYKPDNRLVANFSKYLINTFNGYFIGIPTKVYHAEKEVNEQIQNFWKSNDMDDVLSELAKLTSLYGRAYLFIYQDEDAFTRVAYNDPFDMFVIYNKSIKPSSRYGVRYTKNEDGTYEGQIYEAHRWYNFYLENEEMITEQPIDELGDYRGNLYYGRVPIIEFYENEERQSLIEPVETLINAYHKALSEKANDVDYFADAYMKILGATLDAETIQKLRDNRIINIEGDGDVAKVVVEFLQKPNGDQTQENLLNRLERLIYTISMVTNINESNGLVTPASGESLKIKQQPMSHLARVKERKFQAGLQTMFKMVFNIPTNIAPQYRDEYVNIEYTWSKNTVNNTRDEVEIAKGLEGITSKRTQISQLSFVDDVDAEIEKILEEQGHPDTSEQ